LLMVVKVVSAAPQANTAKISHAAQFDPIANDNVTSIVVQPTESAAPAVTNLQRFGYHAQPTLFVLTFSSALDPARAQDTRNYTMTQTGLVGHHGRPIKIRSAF